MSKLARGPTYRCTTKYTHEFDGMAHLALREQFQTIKRQAEWKLLQRNQQYRQKHYQI